MKTRCHCYLGVPCSTNEPYGIMGNVNAYSEDSREKIVEALRRRTGKSEAARSLGVNLSSLSLDSLPLGESAPP